MIDRKEEWDKIKYDSFLNAIEEAFREHYSEDDNWNRILLKFSQQLIERFMETYGDGQETPLSMETRMMVMEYVMHNN